MMGVDECRPKAESRLKELEPQKPIQVRKAVAREMCRLLDSGLLEEADIDDPTLEYLLGRLDVRDGEDDPNLRTKWNTWVGEMDYFEDNDFRRFQVD